MFHWLAGGGVLSLLFVAFAAVHCLRRGGGGWLLVILLLGPIGAAAYFVIDVLRWVTLPGSAGSHWTPTRLQAAGLSEAEHEAERLDNAPSHAALALAYHAKGRHAEAAAAARRALALDPSLTGARYLLGRSLAAGGDVAGAAAEFALVVEREPDHDYGVAMLALAEAQARAGDASGARATCQRAADSTSRAEALCRLAEILGTAGDPAGARDLYERVIRDAPHAPKFARRETERWASKARVALARLGP